MSFIDSQRGWILGTDCQLQEDGRTCPIALRSTRDGGQTWTPMSAPHAETAGSDRPPKIPQVRFVRFASAQDGWVFGPDLFTTHDGGKTWTYEHRSVITLVPLADTVWAIESKGVSRVLTISNDYGHSWKEATVQPSLMGDSIQLVRSSDRDAWVLASINSNPSLVATHDGGTTWQIMPDPSGSEFWNVRALAVSNHDHLWLLCAGQTATIMQSKRLYTSADGGQRWQITADAPFAGNESRSNGSFPITGHFGTNNDLAVVSPTHAYLALGRYTLMTSKDGGRSWAEAIPYERSNPNDGSIGPVIFHDQQHGWVVAGNTTLFRTVDGGATWQDNAVH